MPGLCCRWMPRQCKGRTSGLSQTRGSGSRSQGACDPGRAGLSMLEAHRGLPLFRRFRESAWGSKPGSRLCERETGRSGGAPIDLHRFAKGNAQQVACNDVLKLGQKCVVIGIQGKRQKSCLSPQAALAQCRR